MSIQLGDPKPAHFIHPAMFVAGLLIGLACVVAATILVDKLGTAMFRRGFAKPFYIRGHRIHHNCIYAITPLAYGILSTLIFLGYIQFLWDGLWLRLACIVIVVAVAIAADFIGDKFWPEIRKNVILHHEWIYSIIPVYLFTYVFVIYI